MPVREQHYVRIDDRDSIAAAFAKRVALSPQAVAYREYDPSGDGWRPIVWSEVDLMVARVRAALAAEQLAPGDRVAIMLRNCKEWVFLDQGAYAQALVIVPLYVEDRPDNIAYCINDAGAKLLFVEAEEHLKRIAEIREAVPGLKRIVSMRAVPNANDPRVMALSDWLPADAMRGPPVHVDGHSLATIVYTSGTTGKPKGVMLSHQNMLQNVKSALGAYAVYSDDVFLSFLPMSHMFERTVGYYLTLITGAQVAFARSIPQLGEDFRKVQPTVIVSVPRIFERLHAAIQEQLNEASPARRRLFEFAHEVGWARFQWHQGKGPWKPSFLLWPALSAFVAAKLLERMGGRLRLCVSGGAALNPRIAHTFLGLGLPICQGYGLTEASPVISVNRLDRNDPESIGLALPGIEVRFGENNSLLVKGPNVMLGYWKNPEASTAVLDEDGWLDTGDQARREKDFLYITGRIKEIIVMANGEKVPPVDMELAMQMDPLVEQAMVIGEAKPYLSALVVLDIGEWSRIAREEGLASDLHAQGRERAEKFVVSRIARQIRGFPGYAQIRRVALVADKWTVDNGMLTPTLKLKRNLIVARHATQVQDLYKGHTA